MNARNKQRETPLHYAVRRYCCDSVIELLSHPDINTRARNVRNKTAGFYVSKRRAHVCTMMGSEQTNKMRFVRNMLKQYDKARNNSGAQRYSGKKYKTLK